MSMQRRAVKGLMAKKRDGKAMAASSKEPSTVKWAAPLCEGRTNFSNAAGSTGNGATGRCAGSEGGVNHPQSGGGNGKIDGGGNTAIDFTSAFKIGYKGSDGEDLLTSAMTSMYKKQKETAIQVHSENRSYVALILNESKLSAEQRARLWHWRLGHCNPQTTVNMSKQGLVSGLDVRHVLNEDCTECDQAKFKKGTFKRAEAPETRKHYPPYYKLYGDGFGGQKSFGTKSLDGGKGAFIFVCAGTGAISVKLYSSKSQFAVLLKRQLIEIEAMDFFTRILVLDGTGENISKDVRDVCDSFHVVIEYSSAGAPQENARAEKGVQDIGRITRALFVGAPHAPQSFWALALLYACIIHFVLPNQGNNGRSPYLMVHRRAPQISRMFFRVWLAPAEFMPVVGSNVRTDELTVGGYFAGISGGGILIARKKDWKIFRVSRRHVRVHEGMYIEHPSVREQRKLLAIKVDEGSDQEELPVKAVPSIEELRPPSKQQEAAVKSGMGSGVGDNDKPIAAPYVEEHLEMSTKESMEKVDALQDAVQSWRKKDMAGGGEAHGEVLSQLRALRDELGVKANHNEYASSTKRKRNGAGASAEGIPSKRGKGKVAQAEVDDANIIGDGEKRGFTATRPDPEADDHGKKSGSGSGSGASGDVEAIDSGSGSGSGSDSESIESEDEELLPRTKKTQRKVYQLPLGARVEIDTTRFDGDVPGSYSKDKPVVTQGTIIGKKSGGVITARWDDGDITDSHWSHLRSMGLKATVESMLMAAECMGMYASVALLAGDVLTEEAKDVANKVAPPRNFFECLLRDDWKLWLESIRREMKGWEENDAFEEIDFDDASLDHPILELAELFSVKRDGRYKLRLIALGNILRKGMDYKETFAPTVTADGLRWFLSMACSCNKQIYGGDVATAYLTGKQRTDLSAFIPSFGEMHALPMRELKQLRGELQTMEKQEGIRAIRRLSKRKGRPKKLWRLKRPIYGIPDAGNAFAIKFQEDHTNLLKMRQSVVDPCIYWKFRYSDVEGPATRLQTAEDLALRKEADGLGIKLANDGRIVVGYIFLISWVDDVRYFGTAEEVAWYRKESPNCMPITDEGESQEFVSLEIKQDLVAGTLEVTQSKYFLAAAKRFSKYLVGKKFPSTPLPESWKPEEGSDADRAEARGLPYRELIGVLAYPSTYVKLEIRLAISLLSRYLHAPTKEHFKMALRTLMYCVGTHDIGIMYSRGLDEHGVNTLYAYADSNFESPKSTGGRQVYMNGAIISASAQRHSTVDTSTTEAELTECFKCAQDVMGFRNLMEEVGLMNDEPTTIYQDNSPAIQILNQKGSLASRSKFMDIRIFKVREWIDEGALVTTYCNTLSMAADIGTKALGERQFVFCRDLMNGYALVQAGSGNKPTGLSAMCISWEDLQSE